MNLSATAQNLVADVGNNSRQLIGSDVWVCSIEDTGIGPKLAEAFQDTGHVTAFLTTRKQLAVGKRTGSTFAETEITFRIDLLRAGNLSHISPAVRYIASALYDNRLDAALNQLQGSKETAWTQAYHYGLL